MFYFNDPTLQVLTVNNKMCPGQEVENVQQTALT